MRYIDEVINTRKAFKQYCSENRIKFSEILCLNMLYLRYKYGISVNDYFNNRLFDKSVSHKDYFEKNSNTQKKWRYAHRDFMPDAGKLWLATHYIDYVISRVYCPGLNARDYFSYQFYRLNIEAKRTFITDGMLKKMNYFFNGGTSEEKVRAHAVLDNKLLFNRYFEDYIGRKWVYSREAAFDNYQTQFKDCDAVIVKPLDGDGGKGVHKVELHSEEDLKALYEETCNGEFLIEEILLNDQAIAKIHPESLNTIRVYSVLASSGNTCITAAALRVGVGSSVTDNFSSGGLVAEIDCDTGIVFTRAVSWGQGEYYFHPGTNEAIIGLKIPYWDKVKELVRAAHEKLPAMQYIGWDVAICPEGRINLIEANTHAGIEIQQYPSLKGKKSLYRKFGKCF